LRIVPGGLAFFTGVEGLLLAFGGGLLLTLGAALFFAAATRFAMWPSLTP